MKKKSLTAASIISLVAYTFMASVFAGVPLAAVHSPFAEYRASTWEAEKAHLDSFSIELLNAPQAIGYIYVYAERKSCEDEAISRGRRAARWVVGHRGVEAERVRVVDGGYQEQAYYTLLIASASSSVAAPDPEPTLRADEVEVVPGCKGKIWRARKEAATP